MRKVESASTIIHANHQQPSRNTTTLSQNGFGVAAI
jgi:hypothetical protein